MLIVYLLLFMYQIYENLYILTICAHIYIYISGALYDLHYVRHSHLFMSNAHIIEYYGHKTKMMPFKS